jgi:hypothetical protein
MTRVRFQVLTPPMARRQRKRIAVLVSKRYA